MYVIIGATGNTGKPIAEALLNAGKKVRIISRNAEKAQSLVDQGAELFEGSTDDAAFLKKAFSGAKAVYALIPPNFTTEDVLAFQVSHVNAIADALEATDVKQVVTLSSQGAHLEEGNGVVKGLNRMEQRFNKIEGINFLHLRPSYFMENTLGMVGMIKQMNMIGSPIKPDLTFPAIATKDIADYAAKRLLSLDFSGNSHQDLLGSRDVSYSEMAKVYGTAIGLPELSYVQFPPEAFKEALTGQMGASESLADNMNEFISAMNEGIVVEGKRTAESTTATSIEDFAHTFKYVYEMN